MWTLIMKDENADGMCCKYGTDGFYELNVDGTVVKQGSEFKALDKTSFECTAGVLPAPTTCGGTGAGGSCRFPFTYRGKEYTECTKKGHNQPWCYTENGGWGNCECELTCGGTAKGAPCKFPFTYRGTEYTACTTKDHNE